MFDLASALEKFKKAFREKKIGEARDSRLEGYSDKEARDTQLESNHGYDFKKKRKVNVVR